MSKRHQRQGYASQLVNGHYMELWRGDRKIERFSGWNRCSCLVRGS